MLSMREVIHRVLEAEDQARRLLEAASAEAEGILSEADRRVQELVARVQREAQVEAAQILDSATQEADREKRELLSRAEAEIKAQVQLEETAKERAVEAVVRCVCGFR